MISKSLTPLRQKDIRTGAEQERKRILEYLEKLYDDEYGRTLTLGKVIWLIKEENK
jgi:hypothetical protein